MSLIRLISQNNGTGPKESGTVQEADIKEVFGRVTEVSSSEAQNTVHL